MGGASLCMGSSGAGGQREGREAVLVPAARGRKAYCMNLLAMGP